MNCEEFQARIEHYAGDPSEELPPHARECESCAASVRRARLLAVALGGLPRESAPPLPASAILARRERERRLVTRTVLRVAAAILAFAGLTATVGAVLRSGPHYQPLDLEFIQVSASGEPDVEIPIEEMFGSDILQLPANGGPRGASNR